MLVASTSVSGFNCTTPAASSWRTPPSQLRASARSRVRWRGRCGRGGGGFGGLGGGGFGGFGGSMEAIDPRL